MQHRSHVSRETMGGNENQDFGKVDHPKQAHVGRQWETIGGNGRQWETMGNTWRQPETRIDKKGDKGRQDFGKADTPSNTGTHVGTMGDNSETRRPEGGHTIQHRCTHAGRQWERMGSMGDQGRQDLEKAGTPCKQGNDGRRQGETRPCEGGHTIQHKRILWGDNRRQAETRPREGRHTIQHRHMWGDSGRQWQTRERPEKADIPSQAHMWGDNGRQKGKTTRREGGPTIQHRQTCGETMRDNALNGTEGVRMGDETLGRRTRHPTQAHMWGDNERQDVRKADAPSNTDTHVGRQWETLGDKGETRH